jgi:hypothetical protein
MYDLDTLKAKIYCAMVIEITIIKILIIYQYLTIYYYLKANKI